MKVPFLFRRVGVRDIAIFARQLSVLVGASVPVVTALRIVGRQTTHKELRLSITRVADSVESGERVSDALQAHPDVFDDFFINMIRSGETAGRMGQVLDQLADEKEKDYELVSRLRGAMIYPCFILGAIVVVGTILMIFVIPQLTNVLRESGVALPLLTRMLIGFSIFLQRFGIVLFIAIGGGIITFIVGLRRSAALRLSWDLFKLRIPFVGGLFQKVYLARFAQGLTTLMQGGVTLVAGLKVVSEAVGNKYYRYLILETVRHVEDGDSITTVFAQNPYVPAMVNQMLAVGEETGKMTMVLEKLTSFYRREIDTMVNNLVSFIEPVVMAGIGIAVGLMVASVIIPMFRLTAQT